MELGDLVVRKSYGGDITFKIIDMKATEDGKIIYVLKGVNLRIQADSPEEDLERIEGKKISKVDAVFNNKINESIKKVLRQRESDNKAQLVHLKKSESSKLRDKKKRRGNEEKKDNVISTNPINVKSTDESLIFGRPGRILHIDGDSEYLELCLKTYKELSIEAVGRAISEKNQPEAVLELVKEFKPDIVVITGHDGMIKGTTDFMDLNNYRNTKFFVDTVKALRNHENSYDDLVIFAGACQSCYEAILDAGAN